ncbi:MAG: hypothetical protein AB9836_04710 [Aminipila sp.]
MVLKSYYYTRLNRVPATSPVYPIYRDELKNLGTLDAMTFKLLSKAVAGIY